MVNLLAIRKEIEKDLYIHKVCESCEKAPSEYLYIVQSLFFGIFHLCEDCQKQVKPDVEEFKSNILKKFQAICWEDFEEAPVDMPLR